MWSTDLSITSTISPQAGKASALIWGASPAPDRKTVEVCRDSVRATCTVKEPGQAGGFLDRRLVLEAYSCPRIGCPL